MADDRRIALVTGGGSGIGAAICERLARDGMRVAVLDIDYSAAEQVTRSLADAGGDALAIAADVADREAVEAGVALVRAALGPVQVLVNNAGIENFTPVAAIDAANWDSIMAVNLTGAFNLVQAVLPDMRARRWGRIINLASIAAQTGAANMVHYAASKGGLVAMTRSLAVELGAEGITVNAIAPGFIDTPMARRAIAGGKFAVSVERMVAAYPIPRQGKPEEVAAACAFFASGDTAYITGQLLGVNGGTAM